MSRGTSRREPADRPAEAFLEDGGAAIRFHADGCGARVQGAHRRYPRPCYRWTDSRVVLAWLEGHPTRGSRTGWQPCTSSCRAPHEDRAHRMTTPLIAPPGGFPPGTWAGTPSGGAVLARESLRALAGATLLDGGVSPRRTTYDPHALDCTGGLGAGPPCLLLLTSTSVSLECARRTRF